MNKTLTILFSLFFSLTALASNSPYGMFFQPLNANGKPYPGAKMYCLGAGLAWPAGAQVVYTDYNLATPASNPLVADSKGVFPAHYLAENTGYKFIIYDSSDSHLLRSDDNVFGGQSGRGAIISGISTDATPAVTGSGSGTGDGVRGYTTAGTGYAGRFWADQSSPVRAAIRLMPQDTDPTTPLEGDIFVYDTTGKIREYDGTRWSTLLDSSGAVTTAQTAGVDGLAATGNTTGSGVHGTGGATSGIGVEGTAGAPNGTGVSGTNAGSGVGVYGVAAAGSSGAAVSGYVVATGTGNAVRATTAGTGHAFRITPQAEPTAAAVIGDIYVDAAGVVHICTTAGTPCAVWTHVGAQP